MAPPERDEVDRLNHGSEPPEGNHGPAEHKSSLAHTLVDIVGLGTSGSRRRGYGYARRQGCSVSDTASTFGASGSGAGAYGGRSAMGFCSHSAVDLSFWALSGCWIPHLIEHEPRMTPMSSRIRAVVGCILIMSVQTEKSGRVGAQRSVVRPGGRSVAASRGWRRPPSLERPAAIPAPGP